MYVIQGRYVYTLALFLLLLCFLRVRIRIEFIGLIVNQGYISYLLKSLCMKKNLDLGGYQYPEPKVINVGAVYLVNSTMYEVVSIDGDIITLNKVFKFDVGRDTIELHSQNVTFQTPSKLSII